MAKTYTGSCFCGAVAIEATGDPATMGYCHCQSCRHWSAGPINAFTLWPTANVKVTKGQAQLATYKKTDRSHRQYCRRCGGHVMTAHPGWNLIDVYAAILPDLAFEPKVHVNYAEKAMPMRDGLPKFKDVPAEMGGSGETLAE